MSFVLLQKQGPHLKSALSDQTMMWAVVLALMPTVVCACLFFAWQAVVLILVTVGSCVASEALLTLWRGRKPTLLDGSAVLTGLLLALIYPPSLPLPAACLGGIVAISLGKAVFGGLGMNIFNPALVGRAFLQAAFPVAMTTWTANRFQPLVESMSSATPLAVVKFREAGVQIAEVMPSMKALFLGQTAGSLGETSALALLIGGSALLIFKIANWRIPLAMCLGATLFSGVLWLLDPSYPHPLFHLLSGGFLFGALFMATDLVTSPMTGRGMWYFGLGIGFLTVLIRVFGGLPEGVMYSILLMNATVPLIDRATRPQLFGSTSCKESS